MLFCSVEDAVFPDMAALQMSERGKRNIRKETSLKTPSEEDKWSRSERILGQKSSPALLLQINSYRPFDKSFLALFPHL